MSFIRKKLIITKQRQLNQISKEAYRMLRVFLFFTDIFVIQSPENHKKLTNFNNRSKKINRRNNGICEQSDYLCVVVFMMFSCIFFSSFSICSTQKRYWVMKWEHPCRQKYGRGFGAPFFFCSAFGCCYFTFSETKNEIKK